MKRLLILAAALAGAIGFVASQPVSAAPTATPSNSVADSASVVTVANAILALVPTPAGWDIRHVCYVDDSLNKSACLYFPWPN